MATALGQQLRTNNVPPRRNAIAKCAAYDACHPLFVPFTAGELQKLKKTRTVSLPTQLASMLRRHHTPVRALFQFLDGDSSGLLTRYELRTSLRCLGIDRSDEEVDALFRACDAQKEIDISLSYAHTQFRVAQFRVAVGMLETAIEDGEVALPFRCVQKALLGGARVSSWVTAQAQGRQGLTTRLQRAEADMEAAKEEARAARVAEHLATERAVAAEAAAARATEQAAKLTTSTTEKADQNTGLQHCV